ncbi:uncharacterized protein VTP21DRAFT_513 [Calcarisporiella thermophila]|uniref:uncharacterized protein n=1 Tax=Calcarisporiella thermophila TaxID=911321 RepID=UPI003741FFFD
MATTRRLQLKGWLTSALLLCISLCQLSRAQQNNPCSRDKINSTGFQVEYHETYKVVTNAKNNEKYVLQCTDQKLEIPGANAYFKVPLEIVYSRDLEPISFIELLGELNKLKQIPQLEQITSQCVINSLQNNTTTTINVDQPSDFPVFITGAPSNDKHITLSLTDDQTPLEKAEWIKFVSTFFNREDEANKLYDQISNSYNCHKQNLANVNRKSIAWVEHLSDGSIKIKSDKYYTELISDAGGDNLKTSTVLFKDQKELHDTLSNVWLLIDSTQFTNNNDSFDTWKKLFGYTAGVGSSNEPFLRERRVFRTDGIKNNFGYSDWVESSAARPDLVLQDLIAAEYSTYQKTYTTHWLYNFARGSQFKSIPGCSKVQIPQCQSNSFSDQENTSVSSGLSTGAKVGIGISVSIVVIGILSALFLFYRRIYERRFVRLNDNNVQLANFPRDSIVSQ